MLIPKAATAIKRLHSHRFTYCKQINERMRRLKRFQKDHAVKDPKITELILNPLHGL